MKPCQYKKNLSDYFYDSKLRLFVKNSEAINKLAKLPKISSDRLEVLFEAALPESHIENWIEFAEHPKTADTLKELKKEISKEEIIFQEFHIFHAYYYSSDHQKVHQFDLKLSKKKFNDGSQKKGTAKIIFTSSQGGVRELIGEVVRIKDKITVHFTKPDDGKRIIIFALLEESISFSEMNFFQGIYMGDKLDEPSKLVSLEFIAARKDKFDANRDYVSILTVLLLRRHIMDVSVTYNLKLERLNYGYFNSNAISFTLKDIINRIRTYQIVFLHFSHSDNIILSKIMFKRDQSKLCLTYPVTAKEKEKEVTKSKHDCHLSAAPNGTKVVITTFKEDRFKNAIVIKFNDSDSQVFNGTISYMGKKNIYTTFLVAIIDEINQSQDPRKLTEEDISSLMKVDTYKQGLKELEDYKKNG